MMGAGQPDFSGSYKHRFWGVVLFSANNDAKVSNMRYIVIPETDSIEESTGQPMLQIPAASLEKEWAQERQEEEKCLQSGWGLRILSFPWPVSGWHCSSFLVRDLGHGDVVGFPVPWLNSPSLPSGLLCMEVGTSQKKFKSQSEKIVIYIRKMGAK